MSHFNKNKFLLKNLNNLPVNTLKQVLKSFIANHNWSIRHTFHNTSSTQEHVVLGQLNH